MTEPVSAARSSNLPVVLRILLVILCLIPAVTGLLVIAAIFGTFIYEGFRFRPSDEVWMQLFLGAAAVLLLLPAIAIGIVLRFARWQRAATASLVVAILVGGSGALVSGMLQTTVVAGDSESYIMLMMFSVAGIVIGALPPFLHWWNARDHG